MIFDQPPVSFPALISFQGEGTASAAPAGLRSFRISSSAGRLITYDPIKIPTTCRLVPAQRFCENALLSIDKEAVSLPQVI